MRSLAFLVLALPLVASAQVDHLFGSASDAPVWVTPEEAVTEGLPDQSDAANDCLQTTGTALQWGECGSGGGGSSLPAPPTTGKAVPESTAGVIAWQTLQILLEEELYTALRMLSTGTILRIGSLDPGKERATIAGITPSAVVNAGVPPAPKDNSCLKTTPEGLAWVNCDPRAYETSAPKALAPTANAGLSTKVSRGDHVHPGQPLPSATALADNTIMQVTTKTWRAGTADGPVTAALRNITGIQGTRVLTAKGSAPPYTFEWAPGGSGTVPPYRNSTPPNVNYVTSGHPGTENSISRGDHVHSLQSSGVIATATPKAPGTAAAGSGTQASAADHVHPQEFPSVAPTADLEVLTTVNGVLLWDDLFGKLKAPPRAADQGKVVRVTDDLDTAKTEFVYDDPHATVLDGLPAITGQGGKVLTVNSAATGVAWESGGGGSGTGGGEGWKARYTWDAADGGCTANCTNWGVTFSDADATAFNAIAGDDELELRVILETQFRANDSRVYVAYLATNPSNRANRKLYGTAPYADAPAAFNVEITLGTSSNIAIRANDASGATITMDIRRLGAISLESRSTKTGGGGGGSSGPTIPEPTTAGKLKHLRVNAAGAAYELADPPVPRTPGALIKSIKSGSNVAGTETTYARTDHEHAIPSALYGTPVDIGRTNKAGTATTLARSDHVHEGRTADVFPSIPGDHADHEYLLTPNSTGNDVEWTHGIDDALQENAADIGAADRRIDDLVTPSFDAPYPEDGWPYSTSECLFNVDLQKEVCKGKWQRPAYWERVKIYDNEFSDWSGPTQNISIPTATYDIQGAMQSPVTAFREFEVHLTWAKRANSQRTIHQTIIRIGGMATNGNFAADDNGVFHSQNSLNSVSGNIGWARLEVFHDAASKLVVNFNVQSETFVRAILTGIR